MKIRVTRAVLDALSQAARFVRGETYNPGEYGYGDDLRIAQLIGVTEQCVLNWRYYCDCSPVTPQEQSQLRIANFVAQFPNYETHALRCITEPKFWASLSPQTMLASKEAMKKGEEIRAAKELAEENARREREKASARKRIDELAAEIQRLNKIADS